MLKKTKSGGDDANKNQVPAVENTESEFGEINLEEQPGEVLDRENEMAEKKEPLPNHEASEQKELRKQIEAMDAGETPSSQPVSPTAQDVTPAAPEEKIRKLLLIAQEKGVVYAVNVAKKMDDPYILDLFHDALAQKGFYKKFKE